MSKDTPIKFINAIFLISTLVSSILICIIFTRLQNSNYSYLTTLGNNWSKGPISEIKIQAEKEKEKMKFSKDFEPIINNSWKGTEPGCFCKDEKIPINAGKCNRLSLKNGCKNIEEIPPMEINTWKGKKFVGKILDGYLYLHTEKNPENCGKDKKSCGKIDTLGNFLCLPKDAKCPINSIQIVKSLNNEVKKFKKNSQIFQISQNEKIIFSNDYEEYLNKSNSALSRKNKSNEANHENQIIAQFRIDDDTPCLSANNYNIKHEPYLLERISNKKKNRKNCENLKILDQNFEQNYQLIDSSNYNKLFRDNKIMPKISKLPKFSTEFNYFDSKVNLYVRNFIGLEKKCLKKMLENSKISRDELLNNLKNAEKNINDISFISFVASAFSIVTILLTDIFIILYFLGERSIMRNRPLINKSLLFGITLPMLFLTFNIFMRFISPEYDFYALGEKGCTDDITSFALNEFNNDISFNKYFSIVAFIMCFYAFVTNIIVIFHDSFNEKEYKKQRNLGLKNSSENLKEKMKENIPFSAKDNNDNILEENNNSISNKIKYKKFENIKNIKNKNFKDLNNNNNSNFTNNSSLANISSQNTSHRSKEDYSNDNDIILENNENNLYYEENENNRYIEGTLSSNCSQIYYRSDEIIITED